MLSPRQIIPEYGSYLRIERSMSENTVSSYVSDLSLFFDHAGKAPEEISADDIVAYFSDRRSISKRTQARILSALRSFFNYLILEGYIADNPCDQVDAPKIGRRLPEVLSVDEINAMISSVDTSSWTGLRDRAMLEVMYGCGLRVSEATGLKVSEIYFKEGFVRIVGKGNKERIVFLPDDLRPVIDAWISVRGDEDGIFFPRMKPGKLHEESFIFTEMSPISIYRILKFRSEQARIKDLRPHDLRRTFASRMLDAGCDLSLLQKAMGHSSPATTARYDRRDEKSRIKACRALRFD